MEKIFNKICIDLMLINDNVYTFISGILLSVSTGGITTLCFEKIPFGESWHLYASSLFYTIAGAMLIYVTSQVSSYQAYILSSREVMSRQERHSVIKDFESYRSAFWVKFYCVLCLLLIAGTVLLFVNYVI